MRVLVTGAGGQLGRELCETGKGWTAGDEPLDIVGLDRRQLDVTDPSACREAIAAYRPDAVIHAAAWTAVDRAEEEPDEAFRVNAAGTRNMAVAAREGGAKFCYVSTDYVFDGRSSVPYSEYDLPNPLNVYGKSKLAGERLTQSLADRWFIVRTSWVYGAYGANFVNTMLRLGAERETVRVVRDQIGSPTWTRDLAEFLLRLVTTEGYGIYHATNAGHCSWYEFAKAIFEEKGLPATVVPCTTDEFPRPAPRPAYSVLDHAAIRYHRLPAMRHWREALREFLHGKGH
jgi:dTDP-4-dehydrorhamnose reductase